MIATEILKHTDKPNMDAGRSEAAATESSALRLAAGMDDAIPELGVRLAGLPAFQRLIAELDGPLSTRYYAFPPEPGRDDETADARCEESFPLRILIAEVFLAGVLHGKLFNSAAVLNPYGFR